MGANSALRRRVKKLLRPILSDGHYRVLQAMTVAWDIVVGNYPEPELRLIPIAVIEGDTVLDIGANYGFYTYHLARAVGRSGCVYAFEPVPFTKDVLELVSKILRFRNVKIYAKGCSDQEGNIAFQIPLQSSGAITSGLAYMNVSKTDQGQERASHISGLTHIKCDVVALDQFLPALSNLSFIKCDIEGTELLAFRGAEAMINLHHPTVLCEIDYEFLNRANLHLPDLLDFFLARDYKLYQYVKEDRLTEVSDVENNVKGNYIFIHPCRSNRFADLFS